MTDSPLPIPIAPLTADRVELALRKRGVWKPCATCGENSRAIVPVDNKDQCLSIEIIEFWTTKPIIKTANIALVCLECGHADFYDYVLINRFVTKSESEA